MTNQTYLKGMLDVFGRLGLSAIAVGHNGRVIELNDEARKHLGSCIRIVQDRLSAVDRTANERLQALIVNAPLQQNDKNTEQESFVVLPRSGGRPVIAYAAPVRAAAKKEAADASTIVLLVSQDNHRKLNTTLLRKLFAFTPAELRLTVALARGHDLQSIAETYNVTVGTLRIHLKSIFEKTNTSRQAELILLMARLSTGLA